MEGWLIGGGLLILVVALAYFLGRKSERQSRSEDRLDAIADKKEKDDEVDALAPADLDARFDRWMRDKR